jgi:23S rRNA (uridine2552-2'-O)-methyltransferase
MTVIDCGAAPGSWTQVLVKRCNSNLDGMHSSIFEYRNIMLQSLIFADKSAAQGKVIAVDIQEMKPIDGANLLENSDFTSPEVQQAVLKLLLPAGMV